jgi:branched-chain amino acid transport system permease protein
MTFNLLLFLMLGGTASLAGPLVGTLAVLALTQWLQAFEQYQSMVLGPVLVLVVIFVPHGLAGLARGLGRLAPPLAQGEPVHAVTGREAGA